MKKIIVISLLVLLCSCSEVVPAPDGVKYYGMCDGTYAALYKKGDEWFVRWSAYEKFRAIEGTDPKEICERIRKNIR